MRILAFTLAVCSLACVAPVFAQLPATQVPASVRSDLTSFERAILQDAGRAILGQSTNWASGDGLAGTIRFRNEFSRSKDDPSIPCEACLDPCRTFITTYRSAAGQGEFRGVACYIASSNGYRLMDLQEAAWLPAPPQAAPSAPPAVPPETIIVQQAPAGPVPMTRAAFLAEIAAPLTDLGYASADREVAFADYVRDYGLATSITVVSAATRSEQLAMIEAARTRARQDGTRATASTSACAALHGRAAPNYFGICR